MFYFATWSWDALEWEQTDKKSLKQASCAAAFTRSRSPELIQCLLNSLKKLLSFFFFAHCVEKYLVRGEKSFTTMIFSLYVSGYLSMSLNLDTYDNLRTKSRRKFVLVLRCLYFVLWSDIIFISVFLVAHFKWIQGEIRKMPVKLNN